MFLGICFPSTRNKQNLRIQLWYFDGTPGTLKQLLFHGCFNWMMNLSSSQNPSLWLVALTLGGPKSGDDKMEDLHNLCEWRGVFFMLAKKNCG